MTWGQILGWLFFIGFGIVILWLSIREDIQERNRRKQ